MIRDTSKVGQRKHSQWHSQYHLSTLVSDQSQYNWHREPVLSYGLGAREPGESFETALSSVSSLEGQSTSECAQPKSSPIPRALPQWPAAALPRQVPPSPNRPPQDGDGRGRLRPHPASGVVGSRRLGSVGRRRCRGQALAGAAGLEDPDRRRPAPWPGRGLPSSHVGKVMKLRTRSVLVRGSWRPRDCCHVTVTVAVLNSE
jgi:hypothetical protein